MAAVKIGHASCDEYGRASGGKAGDQTGREVCVRDWYRGNWNIVLRPKSSDVAEKMAAFCEAGCNNPKVGYDQGQRNTLRAAAREAGWQGAKIARSCETDCSAFMTVCAEAAGVNVSYTWGNAPTTWTMRGLFMSTGAFNVLMDNKYLTTDKYLKRGDILVRESGHTAMALSNGDFSGVGTASYTSQAAGTVKDEPTETEYTVIQGDTLWGIAVRYHVTVPAICEANGIDSRGFIYPGQKIKIPQGG